MINPIINNNKPNFIFSLLNLILNFSWGNNSFNLKIGPAINCGKYRKYSLKLVNLISSLDWFFLSTITAIAVKVINDIAKGSSPEYVNDINFSKLIKSIKKKEYLKYIKGKSITKTEIFNE